MSKIPIIAVGLGILLAAGGTASAAKAQPSKKNGDPAEAAPSPPPYTQNETRQLLYGYAVILEQALLWAGLATFLDAVAYTESRWKLRPGKAAPVSGSNAAVGPYQIRPRSGGDTDALRATFRARPWLLEDPRIATAAVVAYLSRMSSSNSHATWAQGRASLAFPVYIHGRPTSLIENLARVTKYKTLAAQQKRYDDSVRRFADALVHAGYADDASDGVALAQGTKLFPRKKRYKVEQILPLLGLPLVPEGGGL